MTLTEACKPRTFFGEIWYSDTTQSLRGFQLEAARRDDEEKQKQRQKYLDQLKEELKILNDADSKGCYHLVEVIQEKFPPKNTVKKFKESDKGELDKCKEMEEFDRDGKKVGEWTWALIFIGTLPISWFLHVFLFMSTPLFSAQPRVAYLEAVFEPQVCLDVCLTNQSTFVYEITKKVVSNTVKLRNVYD